MDDERIIRGEVSGPQHEPGTRQRGEGRPADAGVPAPERQPAEDSDDPNPAVGHIRRVYRRPGSRPAGGRAGE